MQVVNGDGLLHSLAVTRQNYKGEQKGRTVFINNILK